MTQDIETLKTSGDPLADRRYAYGAMLRGAGDLSAAADLFAQTLELAPRWIAAWVALAEVRQELGDAEGTMAAWREALILDPADPLGVELKLALSGLAPAPVLPPEGYVRALFDDYAPGFEQALVGQLGYRAPLAIREAVAAALPATQPSDRSRPRFARALDLGCGTGLTGEALRGAVGWLEGIDLSPGMVDQARAKRVFDALHVEEAVRFLAAEQRRFDLITAGDLAPYLGDLAPLLAHCARTLQPGGVFVMTAELLAKAADGDWRLRPTMRYAHSAAYLRAAGAAAGLECRSLAELPLRLDRGEPVMGALVTYTRAGPVAADMPHPATPAVAPAPAPPTRRPRIGRA